MDIAAIIGTIIKGAGIAFLAILGALLYYILMNGFLSDVAIRRLTKASFRIKFEDVLDLGIAYFIGMLAYIYILFFGLIHSKDSICLQEYCEINAMSLEVLYYIEFWGHSFPMSKYNIVYYTIIGLLLLYIGRITTKRKGVFYGRIHFSLLFVSSSLLILIDSILAFSSVSLDSINALQILKYHIQNYFIFFSYFSYYPFIGCILLATIGELFLSYLPPNSKSLLAISEKFPSNCKVISGKCQKFSEVLGVLMGDIGDKFFRISQKEIRYFSESIDYFSEDVDDIWKGPSAIDKDDGLSEKIQDLLIKDEIIKLKCITKSLRMIDEIEGSIENHYSKAIERGLEPDYRILKAPTELAIIDYEKILKTRPSSIGDIIGLWKAYSRRYRKIYYNYLKKLRRLEAKDIVRAKDYYFGKIVFIIVEYINGEKEILFSLKDTGPMMRRVGLSSNEPYFIGFFEKLFDSAWNTVNYDHIAKGKALFDQGRYLDALIEYNQNMKICPMDPESLNNRALVFIALGNYEYALRIIDECLDTEKITEKSLIIKGLIFYMLGLYQESIDCCDIALETNPNSIEALYRKGKCLHELGKVDEANSLYEMAIAVNPMNESDRINRGYALLNITMYIDANEEFYKIIKLNPKNYEAWIGLGQIFHRRKWLPEAIICYNESIDISPQNFLAWKYKGDARESLGDPKAKLDFQEAKRIRAMLPFDYGSWI